MSTEKKVRVGNAGGYWGDDPHALKRQLRSGNLDYLTQDFLAEITMSILQKQRARNPALGYAVDFIDQINEGLPYLSPGKPRIISNAGGINPLDCGLRVQEVSSQKNLKLRIAVVTGDDLLDRLPALRKQGISLDNLDTGESFGQIQDRVLSANAYLGIAPVVEALKADAELIVTGRVTDTAIVASAPVYEFDWELEDWDRLASAVVAGHILECGAQATGGNLTDWEEISSFQEMGYPIAEFSSDSSFIVSKPAGSGGQVNRKTLVSQLVYEMGDPRNYVSPDVVADFTTIQVEELEGDQVRISGVRGRPRPEQLKVSVSYFDGYKAHGTLIVSGPKAVARSRKISDLFWKRLDLDFEETAVDLVGYNACHGHLAPPADPPEILLRLGARDPEKGKLEEFARVFTSLILSSVPGVAIVGSRPRVQEVVAYWPCLIPANQVTPEVHLLGDNRTFQVPWTAPSETFRAQPRYSSATEKREETPKQTDETDFDRLPLREICYARSGDKGDICNIGLVARSEEIYQWIRQIVTAEKVKAHFGEIAGGTVERYEIPNLWALNFLLHESLGGGGTVSLKIDPQGKTLADALLEMIVPIPKELTPARERLND